MNNSIVDNGNKSFDSLLSKEDTKILKGIAIILMLIHHLWTFSDRLPGTLNCISGIVVDESLSILGDFGKICVAMFAFLGGYGKYCKYGNRPVNIVREIYGIYKRYWRVFLIFIPIGFLFFSNQTPYCLCEQINDRFTAFSMKELMLNFFGLESTYNWEWWFLFTYIICVMLFPFMKRMVEQQSILVNLTLMILFQLVIMLLAIVTASDFPMVEDWFRCRLPCVVCFYCGVIVSRYGLYSKIYSYVIKLRVKPLIGMIAFAIVFLLRYFCHNSSLDFLFASILIIVYKIIIDSYKPIRKPLEILGKHSTNMWLVHTFFCYYFGVVAKSIVFFRWAVPALVVLIAYSLIASILIDFIWKYVDRIGSKIRLWFVNVQ